MSQTPQVSQNLTQDPSYMAAISPNFFGRKEEIKLFVEKVLKPVTPTYSILAIGGGPGVGKAALLNQCFQLARSPYFTDSCLPLRVDGQRLLPDTIMRDFADQLSENGCRLKEFEREWYLYKDRLQQRNRERDERRERLVNASSDAFGAVLGTADPISQEGTDITVSFLTRKVEEHQHNEELDLSDHLGSLTQIFIHDLMAVFQPNASDLPSWIGLRRILLFFDYVPSETTSWLLDDFLPRLDLRIHPNVGLILATNATLEKDTPNGFQRWRRYSDNGALYSVELKDFTEEETTAYLKLQDITDATNAQSMWQLTEGLPYYLYLLTAHNTKIDIDPRKTVVENFLAGIPEEEKSKRWLALAGALLTMPFSQDDLAALPLLAGQDMDALYDWLVNQPFVHQQQDRIHYDPFVQDLFCQYLRDRSPKQYNTTRTALKEHYWRQLQEDVGLDVYVSERWLPLALAFVSELLLLQSHDEEYRCHAIEWTLRAYGSVEYAQVKDIGNVLDRLAQDRPHNPIDEDSRLIAEKLLLCIREDLDSQKFIDANSYLLERAAQQPTFPHEVLARIYLLRGHAYGALHNYRQAVHDFDELIALRPKDDAREYGRSGLDYRLAKNYQRAIRGFDSALAINPMYIWAYAQRAFSYQKLDEYAKAIDDFNVFIEAVPRSPWAYGQRGKTYRLLKNYQQAIQDLNKAIEIDGQDAWAYAQRGLVHLYMKDLAQARLDYARSQQIGAKDVNYTCIVTWIDMCMQREDTRAIEQLEVAHAPDAPQYCVLMCQGVALWFRKQFDQAQAILEQATQLEPRKWEVRFWHGMACASLVRDEDAVTEIRQALTLGLPSILLAPLNWYQQSRSDFYEQYIKPIIEGAMNQGDSKDKDGMISNVGNAATPPPAVIRAEDAKGKGDTHKDPQDAASSSPITVFYSYAHEDEALQQRLKTHLSGLRRQGLISEWYDRQIVAGSNWADEIDAHLDTASAILLLVSQYFMDSNYCARIEMTRALERHDRGEAIVIPIILRPCDWQHSPLENLQSLPRDGRPVTDWSNRDKAFLDIVVGIRTAIEQLSASSKKAS